MAGGAGAFHIHPLPAQLFARTGEKLCLAHRCISCNMLGKPMKSFAYVYTATETCGEATS